MLAKKLQRCRDYFEWLFLEQLLLERLILERLFSKLDLPEASLG